MRALAPSFLSTWDLLGGAMDASANFSQRICIERDNFAVGIMALQGQLGNAVGRGIAKLWGNHRTVADIKIDIGGYKIKLKTFAVMAGLWNHINCKAGTDQRVICFLSLPMERIIGIGSGQ